MWSAWHFHRTWIYPRFPIVHIRIILDPTVFVCECVNCFVQVMRIRAKFVSMQLSSHSTNFTFNSFCVANSHDSSRPIRSGAAKQVFGRSFGYLVCFKPLYLVSKLLNIKCNYSPLARRIPLLWTTLGETLSIHHTHSYSVSDTHWKSSPEGLRGRPLTWKQLLLWVEVSDAFQMDLGFNMGSPEWNRNFAKTKNKISFNLDARSFGVWTSSVDILMFHGWKHLGPDITLANRAKFWDQGKSQR